MAELDLSLSDALTDSIPQQGPESLVERDFVAQLEAETFDDQVKETVGKTDFIPLLDDDGKTDAVTALENGEQETHGVQKPGFSQPGGIGMNVEVGAAPLHTERPPSIAEPQHATPPAGADVPMQAPHNPTDLSTGTLGDTWTEQTGCLSADPPFTPSISMMFSKQASQLAASPEETPDSWPGRESAAYAGGDERDMDGSDRKQKRKKKRRQKDEGSYEHPDGQAQLEVQAQGENTPPAEGFYHRIGPRRDRGDGGWEEQLGKSGGRGKRSKNRKKIPEEWAVMAEPFVPSSVATSQMTEEAVMDQESSAQTSLEASLTGSQSPWEKEVESERGLSHDVFSPLVLNSDLKATAAPFTMPPVVDSFPQPPPSGDQFDLLMDTSLGHSNQAFCPPFSLEKEASGVTVDSRMFDKPSSFQESYTRGNPEGDTSAFSPASQSSYSPKGEVLASAPPLSPSDASWLLNDTHMSSNSKQFDFGDTTSSADLLPLGLSFDTPSPAPLRSPKTTAQEFQPKEHKDAKSSQNQSKKSLSSSSSSSVKSPTYPEATRLSLQASPIATPSSPPSLTPLGIPGSGLNPAAKPFFPSFADPLEEPAVIHQVVPDTEVKSDKKEEKLEGDMKKAEPADSLDKPEQKSVKVEYASSEAPAKEEKEKCEEESVKEEKQTDNMETEKPEEKVDVKKEMEKVESVQKNEEKEEKTQQAEESPVNMDKTEKVEVEMINKVVEKAENVEKMENNEMSKEGGRAENKSPEKVEKPEIKDVKEQHIDNLEKSPETPVELDTSYDVMEKKADTEMKVTAEVDDAKTEKADAEEEVNKTKMEDEAGKPEEPAKKAAQKTEQVVKLDKKTVEKKDNKEKVGAEKTKKPAKPVANGSSTTPSRERVDKKKPAVGVTKPGAAAKMQPTATANSVSAVAAARRPAPSATSTSDKKPTTPKTSSTTAAAGPKRPPASSTTSRPLSSTTTALRNGKPKTTTEKRPLVPKASTAASNQIGPIAATKDGTATTAASKTTARTATSARTTTTTVAKRPSASETDGKQGEEKKPSTRKTSTADSSKPKTTTTTTRSTVPITAASRTRTTAAKPATSSSTTGTVPEKKPLVPRPSRPTTAATASLAGSSSRSTARPNTAPALDTHNIRSKIGSTDNTKHHPGGGKVSSASQNRGMASKEGSQAKVQVVSKKLDFSHVTSRLGSKDNMKHVPGGGKVQILNKKVDVSKVTSKCGSKDNIKHKPGGGTAKIESHKINFREQAQSKVGSVDNVRQSPGGGNIKAEGAQETTEGSGTHLSDGPEPGQARSPVAHENGLKDGAPSDGEGPREPQALDSRIPETN
ncbi:microtubule-associated protein 4 isoform X2 [Melanotaenia boesemani]|uniref:microtubule-associated protein 4 isoform X2 n=1 Tax=Melanotaenia boesemani TaxID=1250792 RepID=UPI001C05A0F7|nr:microtubule-associated protein 4 isoform X2 [Melanotaenia boesemani]